MHVKLYEDISRNGRIAIGWNYPVIVNDRYVMSPSPIPKFDNPKMDRSPACSYLGPVGKKEFTPFLPIPRSKAWTLKITRSR